MRIKRVLLVFLFSLAAIVISLSVAVYAYVYLVSPPNTTAGSSVQQDNPINSNGSTSQNVQTQEIKSTDTEPGTATPKQYNGSTHPYGTYSSPYTWGVDGYNYNSPQAYADTETPSFSPLR